MFNLGSVGEKLGGKITQIKDHASEKKEDFFNQIRKIKNVITPVAGFFSRNIPFFEKAVDCTVECAKKSYETRTVHILAALGLSCFIGAQAYADNSYISHIEQIEQKAEYFGSLEQEETANLRRVLERAIKVEQKKRINVKNIKFTSAQQQIKVDGKNVIHTYDLEHWRYTRVQQGAKIANLINQKSTILNFQAEILKTNQKELKTLLPGAEINEIGPNAYSISVNPDLISLTLANQN